MVHRYYSGSETTAAKCIGCPSLMPTQRKQKLMPVHEKVNCLWCDLTGRSITLLLKMILLKVADIRSIPCNVCLLYEDVTTQPVLHINFHNLHRVSVAYHNILIHLFGDHSALCRLYTLFLQVPVVNIRFYARNMNP